MNTCSRYLFSSLFFILCRICTAGQGFDAFSELTFRSFESETQCFTDIECTCQYTEVRFSGAELHTHKPFRLLQFLNRKTTNKKLIAAVLAFPFPFGIVGLHRIYLGTAAYVPVVYIGTLGGVFGVLPLIDFIAILIEKDINHYIWNNKVFMWMN
ncbi:MAG TPA: NINE protein [Bacteroidia bacterium]|nr:NINE protein [Bacteroidia bacterium]